MYFRWDILKTHAEHQPVTQRCGRMSRRDGPNAFRWNWSVANDGDLNNNVFARPHRQVDARLYDYSRISSGAITGAQTRRSEGPMKKNGANNMCAASDAKADDACMQLCIELLG